MKYFKTKAKRDAMRYEITPKIFREVTKEKYPFEQSNSDGNLVAYGICPHCLNSIQLIGMFHDIKVSPHGKHTGKNINGFPEWNFSNYIYCPYAKKGQYKPPNDNELLEIDDNVIALYQLLKNNFDRIVYILEKTFHIRCSISFWKKALKQYIIRKGYCYPWLTEANLPYIFAYKGLQQINCYSQKFEVGTNLYNTLEAYYKVKFVGTNGSKFKQLVNNEKNYIKPVFRFTNHRQNADEGKELTETITFCIDDNSNGETIYEENISFDETYFLNLIRKGENSSNRKQVLLQCAKEIMPDLQANT